MSDESWMMWKDTNAKISLSKTNTVLSKLRKSTKKIAVKVSDKTYNHSWRRLFIFQYWLIKGVYLTWTRLTSFHLKSNIFFKSVIITDAPFRYLIQLVVRTAFVDTTRHDQQQLANGSWYWQWWWRRKNLKSKERYVMDGIKSREEGKLLCQ